MTMPITVAQFNQYYAGGVFKQVSDADAQGPGTTYNQYALGGVAEQLRVVCGSPLLDQYASGGGVWAQLAAGAS
jgi:hypothetical protein